MSRFWKDAATVLLTAKFPKTASSKLRNVVKQVKDSAEHAAAADTSSHSLRRMEKYRGVYDTLIDRGARLSEQLDVGEQLEDTEIPDFDYKVLMLERNSKSPFMPSAYVFPGGKIGNVDFVDRWSEVFRDVLDLNHVKLAEYSLRNLGIKQPKLTVDESPTERLPMFEYWDGVGRDVSSEIAFRISAIRETFEESGILLCTDKDHLDFTVNPETQEARVDHNKVIDSCIPVEKKFSADVMTKWREEVNKDEHKFVDMCAELNVVPNVWSLHDWSCWLTPTNMPKMHNNRRYDTIFYLACLPQVPDVVHDQREISSAQWASPLDLLCRHQAEELWLAPPQIYELCRLCSIPELEELYKFAKSREGHGLQRWLPVRIKCEDGTIAVLPGDELYPSKTDYEGIEDSVMVSQTITQLRSNTLAHHRFEFFGMHQTNIACTEQQTHGHLSPNLGHRAWHLLRDN